MAPTKPKGGAPKRSNVKHSTKPSDSTSSASKDKKKKPFVKRPPKQVAAASTKKKRRIYTEKELNIPALNTITPAGVQKPKGKKKGKVFVDDAHGMMTILAMVTADKEGQIESKIAKARQLEEIRQARQKEIEARQQEKKSKFEETKDSLRRPRNRKSTADGGDADTSAAPSTTATATKPLKSKKRVSFG